MKMTSVSQSDVFLPVEWDVEKHGVGLPNSVDAQHQRLIAIINRLCGKHQLAETTSVDPSNVATFAPRAQSARKQVALTHRCFAEGLQRGRDDSRRDQERRDGSDPFPNSIAPDLDELVTYCARSLTTEEMLLETYGYPDRAAHAAEHQIFFREVSRAHSLMESHNFEHADLCRLVGFLKFWLADHIPKDRRFAPLLVDKGLKP
jgi:hemerythrin-like metal-binding protein